MCFTYGEGSPIGKGESPRPSRWLVWLPPHYCAVGNDTYAGPMSGHHDLERLALDVRPSVGTWLSGLSAIERYDDGDSGLGDEGSSLRRPDAKIANRPEQMKSVAIDDRAATKAPSIVAD